jgi:catechol 2,3-dioxygenase-like lactoylglutathione lyase family enzyme
MNTLHHIALNCKDINAQEAFYIRYLGFKRANVFKEGSPEEFRAIKPGTTYLVFMTTSAEQPGRGSEQHHELS